MTTLQGMAEHRLALYIISIILLFCGMYDNFGENHTPLHDCHSKKTINYCSYVKGPYVIK